MNAGRGLNSFEAAGDIALLGLRRRDGSTVKTIVDAAIIPMLKEFGACWVASWNDRSNCFYVVGRKHGKRVFLHRIVTDAPVGFDVDHINRDTLDNRRSNLRVCTRSENEHNKTAIGNKNSMTGFRGVTRDPGGYRARIQFDGRSYFLGRFPTPEDASVAIEARRAQVRPILKVAAVQ